MALSQHEMFEKLLDQLDLAADVRQDPSLTSGTVQNVTIHEQSRRYDFTLGFDAILPFQIFNAIATKLPLVFQQIAATDLSVEVTQPTITDELLAQYWQYVVTHAEIGTGIVRELCEKQVPTLENDRAVIKTENEQIRQYLIQQGLGKLEETYRQVGFSGLRMQAEVDEEQAAQSMAAFQAQRAEETAKMAKAAAEVVKQQAAKQKQVQTDGPVQMGRQMKMTDAPQQMVTITQEERSVTVEGYVFDVEVRELRSKRQLLIFKVTDYSSSFIAKKFSNGPEDEAMFARIQKGQWLRVRGSVQEDNYSRELTINAQDIQTVSHPDPTDDAEGEKRVELHLHTNMSQMDAMNPISDYVKRAKEWGHKAIAVTDHAGLQAYPEAHSAAVKAGLKMLYGVEINLVDDGTPVAYRADEPRDLASAEYVVFDVETTGLSAVYDKVIELAAVKMKDGKVIDQFEEMIDPGFPLSELTINLTHITDDMVHGSKSEVDVFKLFQQFCDGAIMVGHNVTFDVGFLDNGYERHGLADIDNPVIDTLELSRMLHPERKNHKLDTLAKQYKVSLEHHHRANADAEATGYLLYALEKEAAKMYGMTTLNQLNDRVGAGDAYKAARPSHAIVFAKTQAGLKNLFKLVSLSNVKYFYRVPRVPRSQLQKLREGLLVGSACSSGEVFTAMMQKAKRRPAPKRHSMII